MIAFLFLIDGEQCFAEADELPPYAVCAVPRMPAPFEHWDAAEGCFVHDAAGEADHAAGPAHIAAMRARKAVEAHLIATGTTAPGFLLVREAALRGIKSIELAAIVMAKAAEAENIELARQAASLPLSE